MKVRSRRTGATVDLAAGETELLRLLLDDVRAQILSRDQAMRTEDPGDPLAELVGEVSAPLDAPDDPAMVRLFPDAYDDPAVAREYRGVTEGSLRAGKIAALEAVLADLRSGGDVDCRLVLSREQVETWVAALNDVRLVLGVRLDVTEDMDDSLLDGPLTDPRRNLYEVYLLLGYLQQELVETLL